jgi:hypothetical protein
MKPLIITLITALAGGAAAAAQADGYQTYQRVVLGDAALSASAAPAARAASYGSYTRYRLHNGASLEVALAEARAIGEQAPEPAPPVYAQALPGYDAYRHVVLGQSLAQIHAPRGDTAVAKAAQAR